MRRLAAWGACAALALGLGACGSDDEDEGPVVATTPTVTDASPPPRTEPLAQTEPDVTQPPERTTTSDRLELPEPDLLGDGDTAAVDQANEQIAIVCDAVANGREPTETQVRDLASGLSDLGKIVRANPDGIFRPPSRPENERTVRAVAEEAVEALRANDCLPDFADRLEQQLM